MKPIIHRNETEMWWNNKRRLKAEDEGEEEGEERRWVGGWGNVIIGRHILRTTGLHRPLMM